MVVNNTLCTWHRAAVDVNNCLEQVEYTRAHPPFWATILYRYHADMGQGRERDKIYIMNWTSIFLQPNNRGQYASPLGCLQKPLILDGNSDIVTLVKWEIGKMIYSRHLLRSTAVVNLKNVKFGPWFQSKVNIQNLSKIKHFYDKIYKKKKYRITSFVSSLKPDPDQ